MRFVHVLAVGSSVAVRALLLFAAAHAVSIMAHEAMHLQQAYAQGEEDLVIYVNPTRGECGGAFLCATGNREYSEDSYLWGEGYPRAVQVVVFFEITLGLASWAYEPLRRRPS